MTEEYVKQAALVGLFTMSGIDPNLCARDSLEWDGGDYVFWKEFAKNAEGGTMAVKDPHGGVLRVIHNNRGRALKDMWVGTREVLEFYASR